MTRRCLALWLALALASPNPAFALRPRAGGMEERTATTQDLAQQLAPASRTAGLEEVRLGEPTPLVGNSAVGQVIPVTVTGGDQWAQGRAVVFDPRRVVIRQFVNPDVTKPGWPGPAIRRMQSTQQPGLRLADIVETPPAAWGSVPRLRIPLALATAMNGLQMNFWEDAAFLVVTGALVKTAKGHWAERPWVFVLDEEHPGLRQLPLDGGQPVVEGIREAIPGPVLIRDGRDVSAEIRQYPDGQPNPNRVRWDPATTRAAFSALGKTADGRLIWLALGSQDADHDVGRVSVQDIAQAMLRFGAVEAILLGGSMDVQQWLPEDGATPGVLGRHIQPPHEAERRLNSAVLVYASARQPDETFVQRVQGFSRTLRAMVHDVYPQYGAPAFLGIAGVRNPQAPRGGGGIPEDLLPAMTSLDAAAAMYAPAGRMSAARGEVGEAERALQAFLREDQEQGATPPEFRQRVKAFADTLDHFWRQSAERPSQNPSPATGLEETPPAVVDEIMTWVQEWISYGFTTDLRVVTPQMLTERIAERLGRTAPECLHWRRALQWRLEQYKAWDMDLFERLPAVEASFHNQTRGKIKTLVAKPVFSQAQVTSRFASWNEHPVSFRDEAHLESLMGNQTMAPRLWIHGSFVGYATPDSDLDLALYEFGDLWPEISPWRGASLGWLSAGQPMALRSGSFYLPRSPDAASPHWLDVTIGDLFLYGGGHGWQINGARLAELYARHHAIRDALRIAARTSDEPPLERPLIVQAAARLRQEFSTGLEEKTDPGDPTVPAPDPATATAAEVARYLRETWRVPVRQDRGRQGAGPQAGSQYIVDQWQLVEASWMYHAVRPREPGCVGEAAVLPVKPLVYPLDLLPIFSTPYGGRAIGVYLGFVEGIAEPVVIKIPGHRHVGAPATNTQIVDRQGIGGRVYAAVQPGDGSSGYALQVMPGVSHDFSDMTMARHHEVRAIVARSEEAGLSTMTLVETPAEHYGLIDAENMLTLNRDRNTAWITAQNAGWAIHELPVTNIKPTERAYLLSNDAALAALALLRVPAGTAPLPVVAVVSASQAERLRAMARQGGFANTLEVWAGHYLEVYDTPEHVSEATVRATATLARRLGAPTAVPEPVSSFPEAFEAFRNRWFELMQGFGLTVDAGRWYPEALQDLYRAAQA